MIITNQKPTEINYLPQFDFTNDFELKDILTNELITKILEPLNNKFPIKINDDNGNTISIDTIYNNLLLTLDEKINSNAENFMNDYFNNTLLNFTNKINNRTKQILLNQIATKNNMPLPSQSVIYTIQTDIIPLCKKYIVGNISSEEIGATFAFYKHMDTLGIGFATELQFEDFKEYFQNTVIQNITNISDEDKKLCDDFMNIKLNTLTEGIILRNDSNDGLYAYSFQRILHSTLFEYALQNKDYVFPVPYDLASYYLPNNIIFINAEIHAKSGVTAIKKDWENNYNTIYLKPKIISNKKLQKLSTTKKILGSSKQNIQNLKNINKTKEQLEKRKRSLRFPKNKPSKLHITKKIIYRLKNMHKVNMSQNVFKTKKMTYQKPSRRNPDDYNAKGSTISRKYYPDIHIYLDTSGSISETNYHESIKTCIKIAKKLNVNLYFNSFSHVLSQTNLVQTQGKTIKQTYKEFQKIHKVTGFTDYNQIYHYINSSKKRQNELSLIISDFEWWPDTHTEKHPKNLYYIPCDVNDWNYMLRYIKNFAKEMKIIEPNIRNHILI